MRSNVVLISLFILVCLLIAPVTAETITGTLGSSTGGTLTHTTGESYQPAAPSWLMVNEIQYAGYTNSIVLFDTKHAACNFDAGAPAGLSIPVTVRYPDSNGYPVATGYIGYQRLWEGVTEIEGYQYITFNSWNISTMTGDVALYLDYNHTNLYNMAKAGAGSSYESMPNGGMAWAHVATVLRPHTGNYLQSVTYTFYNNYTATKPSGLGITGTIYKEVDGTHYGSKAYIINATSNVPITSQSTVTSDDLTFNTNAQSIYIAINTATGAWVNSSTLFTTAPPTTTPTPTQTVPPLDYTLTLNKSAVSYGGAILATIASETDPSLSHVNGISYSYESPTSTPNTKNFFESGSTNNLTNYYKMGATWKGYQETTGDWTNTKAAIPTPIPLIFLETGAIEVYANVNTDNGDNIQLHLSVNVGSGNFITTTFQSYDGTNYGFLQATTINIYNLNTGLWTNGTYFNGKASITTPPNQVVSAYGTRTGYYDAKYENAVTDGTPYSLVFYQIGAPPETDNQTFYVNTFSTTGTRITGALVTIKESGTTTTLTKTTSAAGVAQFQLKHETLYTISGSKTGYIGASTSLTTNTGMSDSISLVLTPVTSTTTVIPTGSWTVSPSYTPTGNMTGFWTPWVNLFSQMGAANAELPLLIAALIIVMCMILGAGVAGVLGAEVMMGFGAIFCVALGLIPIWVVLAIIVLGFLFYGLKVSK